MFELANEKFMDGRSQFVISKGDKMGLRYKPMPEAGLFYPIAVSRWDKNEIYSVNSASRTTSGSVACRGVVTL